MADSSLTLNILLQAQDAASSVMNTVSGSIQQLASGNVMGAVVTAGTAAAAAVAAIGVQAVQTASQYQQSMNMVQALTGSNTAQMAQYDSSLKALSVDAGVAPNQLAQGLYNVLSAGKTGADAMNVLKLATEDAKIGMTDATTTTNALTSVLNNFGVSAADTTRVNGQMLETVTLGGTTFAQYASSITKAANTSVQYGQSMETMNAAFATLTSNRISAAQAVTDYDQSLKVMDGNIGTVTKSLQKNGIAFDEAKFNTMDYGDKVVYLNNALSQARAAHVTITGATQQASMAIQTIAQHIKTYNSDLATLSNGQAMAQKTQQSWAITQQGFTQQVSRLGAAWDVLMVNIGQKLLPFLTKIVAGITPVVQSITNWVAGSGKLTGALSGLQPILTGIGQFVQMIFLPAWQGLVQTIQTQMVPAWNNLMLALQPIMPYLQQFAQSMASGVGAAILLVITIISAFIGETAGLMNGLAVIVRGIVEFFSGMMQTFLNISFLFNDLFTGRWDKLGTDLANIWGGIVKMFQGAWIAIEGVFVTAIDEIIGLVNGFMASTMGPINSVLAATHQATISVGQIPMLTVSKSGLPAVMPTYQSSVQKQSSAPKLPSVGNMPTISAPAAPTVTLAPGSLVPVTNAIGAASGASTANSVKSQQAAQVAAMKLADTQQKALSKSSSSQVQALVDASNQAKAQGNMALAAYDAQKAATLAGQQQSAAQHAAKLAASQKKHQQTLANQAAKKAAADQKKQQAADVRAQKLSDTQRKALAASSSSQVQALINASNQAKAQGNTVLAAYDAQKAATLANQQKSAASKAARHAAKLAQSASHHKVLIDTILQSTNQLTSKECPGTTVTMPSALGVALPDYATGTGYVQNNPITQQAPQGGRDVHHHYNIHVHTDSKDPKDHGSKVADEVKKQLAKHLRQQSIAPRYTSGGR